MLGLRDYAADPVVTFELLRERIASGELLGDHRLFPLPKHGAGSVRALTVLEPLDELVLRAYVGRCAPAIVGATIEDRVLSGLVRRPGPAWFSADFRDQSRLRRELQRAYYEDSATAGVAFFDVENFFGSCRHDTLCDLLLDIGAPPGAVHALTAMLGSVFKSGCGLPIGFEGSAPLANLFMGPLDAALAATGLQFLRWTDDLDVFLTALEQQDEITDLVVNHLDAVHLAPNWSKVAVLEKGPAAEDRLLDPSRDSLFDDDPLANITERLDAAAFLEDLGHDQPLPPAHLRSMLGYLRKERSTSALDYLQDNPDWADREPRAVADYLSALADDPTTRPALDQDWLIDQAVGRSPTKHTAAGQLHMCRVLTHCRIGKRPAEKVLDFATDYDIVRQYPTLGGWGIRAWSESQGWRPKAARELVKAFKPLVYRRAAASGFLSHGNAARHDDIGEIVKSDRDLQPLAVLAARG